MRIINAMFSGNSGGLEQSFFDYCLALKEQSVEVHALISSSCVFIEDLKKASIPYHIIPQFGQWDPIAKWRIRSALKRIAADAIISHGNRAVTLIKNAIDKQTAHIAVTHNYRLKRLSHLDAFFATTKDLQKKLAERKVPSSKIYHLPNMVQSPASIPKLNYKPRKPVIIGSMGRFVKKKGFEQYIYALARLRDNNIPFHALLGGDGKEYNHLANLITQCHLDTKVEMTGWVQDKQQFFNAIDIFCLPSLHEPFGIILLEAMAAGTPVVTSLSEGPREIITPRFDALTASVGSAQELADSMASIIKDQDTGEQLMQNAYMTAQKYNRPLIGKKMLEHLDDIIANKIEA